MTSQEETNKAIEYAEKWDIQSTFEEALTNLLVAHPNDPMGFLYDQIVSKATPPTIDKVVGREILDSKGIPTLEVETWGNIYGRSTLLSIASSPSCDFCSPDDAFVLIDTSNTRFSGRGVRQAVSIVTSAIQPVLVNRQFFDQNEIDNAILSSDGTPNRRKIGTNTSIATSASIAIASAKMLRIPLFIHISRTLTQKTSFIMPRPIFSFFSCTNGPISKVYFIPTASSPIEEQIRIVGEIYLHYLSSVKSPISNDGCFPLTSPNIDDILQAAEIAVSGGGHTLGDDVFLGFRGGKTASPKFWKGLLETSSVVSYIEDPISFDDTAGWQEINSKCNENTIIAMGKGISSRPERVAMVLPTKAIVLKPIQAGTISSTVDVAKQIDKASKICIISTSERETQDTWICDLSVAVSAQYIQLGPIAKGEHVAKINRLLELAKEIEKENVEETDDN